jgi:hypothetical protein
MLVAGQAKQLGRFRFEVDLDEDRGVVANNPRIMPRIDAHDLRCDEFIRAAIGILDMDLAPREEADMCVHAPIGANQRFHVRGPAEADWIHHAFDPPGSGGDDVHLHARDFAAICALDRAE